MSYLSISPSPFSCFIRRPCCSRTVTSTPRSCLHLPCRTVPDPEARVQRTSTRAARSLANWPIPRTPQVVSPTSSTRRRRERRLRCFLRHEEMAVRMALARASHRAVQRHQHMATQTDFVPAATYAASSSPAATYAATPARHR